MARKSFYSFHFKPDSWRAAQVRNIGALDGNVPVSDNDWEAIKKGGDAAIKKWIDGQLKGRSCTVVLVGAETAGRKWISYEIGASWDAGMGVFGICIHNLKNQDGKQTTKGGNPFDAVERDGKKLSDVVKLHDPPYSDSTEVYSYIKKHLASWADTAVANRA